MLEASTAPGVLIAELRERRLTFFGSPKQTPIRAHGTAHVVSARVASGDHGLMGAHVREVDSIDDSFAILIVDSNVTTASDSDRPMLVMPYEISITLHSITVSKSLSFLDRGLF